VVVLRAAEGRAESHRPAAGKGLSGVVVVVVVVYASGRGEGRMARRCRQAWKVE
jgi:hypothetical protein